MLHYDLVVFSHLRWDFVYQRPQHLLSRAAQERRVLFVEEPVSGGSAAASLELREDGSGVTVAVPHLPEGLSEDERFEAVGRLVAQTLEVERMRDYVLWLYSPMFLPATRGLRPRAIVYDCMDELSNFKGASARLRDHERELLSKADVVFTGGHSLWEAKRDGHGNCHCLPSSVDAMHFGAARRGLAEPADMAFLRRPRAGFFGVIDERMDLELLDGVAAALPEVEFVILGPVVKIDADSLPRRGNLHYLGPKSYRDLPAYLAHWDVAMLPFAQNDATRFISPTKTPEYLAAGKPVVSTPIRDVVRPYGDEDLVLVADDAASFAAAIRQLLNENPEPRRARADAFIGGMSWDLTWRKMEDLISRAVANRSRVQPAPRPVPAVTPEPQAPALQTPSFPKPAVWASGGSRPASAAAAARPGGFGSISDVPARLEPTRIETARAETTRLETARASSSLVGPVAVSPAKPGAEKGR